MGQDKVLVKRPVLQVILAGTGNVGSEFLARFAGQQQRLANYVDLKLVTIFNSTKCCYGANLSSDNWQDILADAPSYHLEALLAYCKQLPGAKVLVDITPSEGLARAYPQFIQAGCHIISANKQGVTLPTTEYQSIRESLIHHGCFWLSNTTVGAGIPVQRVLQELRDSGDNIRQISGVFSGTLSWLLCQFDGSKPFSEFVLDAKLLGYTEPDPRDDLSGKDVQRKLLVLARELGLNLDLGNITLTPLLPEGLEQGDWATFWQQREKLDCALAALFDEALQADKLLRYVAKLEIAENAVTATVNLHLVAKTDPLAALAPCDNLFVIESDYYSNNPLVLKGPGAGPIVTAGGVLADLSVLARQLLNHP